MENFSLNRTITPGTYPLAEVFQGLEQSTPLVQTFADALPDVLATTDVKIVDGDENLYMYVDDDGSIVMGLDHLLKSDDRVIYLDLVHELVHIKQFREGRNLFDEQFAYVDRPTEIEAYTVAVSEAKRLGMSRGEILDYLYVEWVSNEDVLRLALRCGLDVEG